MKMNFQSAEDAVKGVKSHQRVFIHGSAATPTLLLEAIFARKQELKNVELVSISTLGNISFNTKELGDSFFVNSLF